MVRRLLAYIGGYDTLRKYNRADVSDCQTKTKNSVIVGSFQSTIVEGELYADSTRKIIQNGKAIS